MLTLVIVVFAELEILPRDKAHHTMMVAVSMQELSDDARVSTQDMCSLECL